MAKLNLIPNPTFTAKVPVIPAGDDAKPMFVLMTFKHRTRKALSEWLNSRDGKTDIESFMDMVSGWEVDGLEFNAENVEALLENYGGSSKAALDVYIDQLFKAKLGN